MPRVSEEHLEARRRQILDAARRCFVANGFHNTSMQDILRESGLSAGAVYRYFPGKEDIIGAIAEEAIAAIRAAFEATPEDLPVGEILDRVLVAVDARAEIDGTGRLALQVWAEAVRSDRLRTRLAAAIRDARAVLADRIRPQLGPDGDAEAVAAFVTSQLPGYIQAKVIVGHIDPASYRRGLDGLAGVLAPAPAA